MNDYWNDPPESPETPECCGDFMDYDEKTGACTCPTCGKHVEPEPDIEPPDDEPSDAEIAAWFAANPSPVPDRCPHGGEWGDCAHCDHASDLAYDAARERACR